MESPVTHSLIREVIQRHRARNQETNDIEWGYSFTVHKDVFSPFIAPSGRLGLSFASLPDFRGRRVLDIGCGSGVIACMMALNGAEKVVGVDINPSAIANARRNAERLNLGAIVEFRHGCLLSPVAEDEYFDIVYADLPFTDGEPADILEAAFYDPQLRSIRTLLQAYSKCQGVRNAKLYLAISSSDSDDLRLIAAENGLTWDEFLVHSLPWIQLQICELSLATD